MWRFLSARCEWRRAQPGRDVDAHNRFHPEPRWNVWDSDGDAVRAGAGDEWVHHAGRTSRADCGDPGRYGVVRHHHHLAWTDELSVYRQLVEQRSDCLGINCLPCDACYPDHQYQWDGYVQLHPGDLHHRARHRMLRLERCRDVCGHEEVARHTSPCLRCETWGTRCQGAALRMGHAACDKACGEGRGEPRSRFLAGLGMTRGGGGVGVGSGAEWFGGWRRGGVLRDPSARHSQ